MLKLKCDRVYLGFMHLGDIITSLNLLYNYAIQYDKKIEFCGQNPDVYKQLFRIFNYGNSLVPLQFCPWKAGYNTVFFKDFMPYYYLDICFGISTLKKRKINGFLLPPIRNKKKPLFSYKCFQFLCRSFESRKSFNKRHMELTLQKFGDENSLCIGGITTKKYVQDKDLFVGNIIQLSEKIMESNGFFGIDSGMAHLAGTLGASGDIVIQANYEDFYQNVKNSFEYMYPTLKIHNKNSL